jgi:predicted lipid-binding transport protein (Tim44 family)
LAATFFAGSATSDAADTSTAGADLVARFTGAFAGSLTGDLAAGLVGALRAGFFATADSSATGAFVSSFFTISGALQAACET